jgi:hypothetical protein
MEEKNVERHRIQEKITGRREEVKRCRIVCVFHVRGTLCEHVVKIFFGSN